MTWTALASAAVLTASAAVVVVQPGETLEQIAQRTLGDAKAAEELKALNGLSDDSVPAGTTLKLPGPERAHALSALVAARNAVAQSGSRANGSKASESLSKAERLFQAAKYAASAAAADETWKLLSGATQQSTRFAIQVGDGETKVTSKSGQAVRVEKDGVARPVHPGQTITVARAIALAAPSPISPPDLARMVVKTSEKGLGSVALTWQAVSGAARYALEIVSLEQPPGKPVVLNVERPEARVALPAGKYAWTVRALPAEGEKSDPSTRRSFELSVEPLKLEVTRPHWK
ncbi:MAG TPA: LysM peptidoglycan-binding domain-containing protein [Myxococcaceae bacterium]|nr:LysM peptidoglycan-binding domain-containing protein [Myxococcaceae bacterium]